MTPRSPPDQRAGCRTNSTNSTSFSSAWDRAQRQNDAASESAQGEPLVKLLVAMTGKASDAKTATGDQPVFAYIAGLPHPQRDIAERIDALAAKSLPSLRRAVKWGMAYYGVDGAGASHPAPSSAPRGAHASTCCTAPPSRRVPDFHGEATRRGPTSLGQS